MALNQIARAESISSQKALTSQLESLKDFDATKHFLTVNGKTHEITVVPKTGMNRLKHHFGCFKADKVMSRFIALSKATDNSFETLARNKAFQSFSAKMKQSSGKNVDRAAFIGACTFSKDTATKRVTSKFATAIHAEATRSGFTTRQTERFVKYAETYAKSLVLKGIYKTDKDITKDAKKMIQTAKELKNYYIGLQLYSRIAVANTEDFKEVTNVNTSRLPRAIRVYLRESFPVPARAPSTTSQTRSYSSSPRPSLSYSERRGG